MKTIFFRFNFFCLILINSVFSQNIDEYKNLSRPNIILVVADDMGWSDLGCYGGEIPTPNIDNLASRGIRFSQFYNNAVCGPTRCSLMTGMYAQKLGQSGRLWINKWNEWNENMCLT